MQCSAGTDSHALYEQTLRELYGSVSEGASFIEAAGAVGRLLDSHMLGLHVENLGSRTSLLQISGPASPHDLSQLMAEYDRHWQGENAWLHRGMAQLYRHGFGDGDDVVTESELLQMPYFTRFLSPLDIRHGVAFLLEGGASGSVSILSINRSRSAGCFERIEKAQLPLLLPHLRSAYRLSKMLQEERQTSASLRALLNAVWPGVALISRNGILREFNEAARHAIEALGCLHIPKKGMALTFSTAADQERLRKALIRALGNASGSASLSMHSQRPPRSRYAIELLRMSDAKSGGPEVCVLISQLDVSETSQEDEARLMQVFGFTASEAMVVTQLAVLGSVEKVAQHLRMSLPTVRTHVQHAFQKTSVHKQTELILLAERVNRRASVRPTFSSK